MAAGIYDEVLWAEVGARLIPLKNTSVTVKNPDGTNATLYTDTTGTTTVTQPIASDGKGNLRFFAKVTGAGYDIVYTPPGQAQQSYRARALAPVDPVAKAGTSTMTGKLGIGKAPPAHADRLYVYSDHPTAEAVVIDSPAGHPVDLLTARVGGVVKFDITTTGSIELNAITFLRSPGDVAADGVGGGGGEISEKVGSAMLFQNGPASNGNQVFDVLATVTGQASGRHHFQYGGATKQYIDTTGIVFNNAQTLWWKDAAGNVKEGVRGTGGNDLALAPLDAFGAVRIFSAGFGAIKNSFYGDGRIGLGTQDQFGGGAGAVIGLANATTVPATNPVGGGVLYAEAGALRWRASDGSIFNTTRQAAQPDTTGATLAALETEVNGLKAKLRAMGAMA